MISVASVLPMITTTSKAIDVAIADINNDTSSNTNISNDSDRDAKSDLEYNRFH